MVLLAVAFRNAGEERRRASTEEEGAVKEESKDGEDVVAVPGSVGNDGGGVLGNMTADASVSKK